jgi:hypothetical protein
LGRGIIPERLENRKADVGVLLGLVHREQLLGEGCTLRGTGRAHLLPQLLDLLDLFARRHHSVDCVRPTLADKQAVDFYKRTGPAAAWPRNRDRDYYYDKVAD